MKIFCPTFKLVADNPGFADSICATDTLTP